MFENVIAGCIYEYRLVPIVLTYLYLPFSLISPQYRQSYDFTEHIHIGLFSISSAYGRMRNTTTNHLGQHLLVTGLHHKKNKKVVILISMSILIGRLSLQYVARDEVCLFQHRYSRM